MQNRHKAPVKPTKQKARRIDFDAGVPEILYKRAGGKCSVPRCKNPTMGPSRSENGSVNMGVACHIYSASEGGPRGQGKEGADFISSERNGIWCCAYHADLIDKRRGTDYPADDLFSWKALAEARARKLMDDIPSPLGWVESVEFVSFPGFPKPPKITLHRRTIMYGPNCSGKSSLLQVAASVNQSKYVERFSGTYKIDKNGNKRPETFLAKITYSTVDTLSKEIFLRIEGDKISRYFESAPCLFPPGDIEIIYCSENDLRRRESEDDVDFLMRVLGVDKCTLFELSRIGTKSIIPGDLRFNEAMEWDEDEGKEKPVSTTNGDRYIELNFRMYPRDGYVTYKALSTSEQRRLLTDMLITKARESCKQRLTLFIVEDLAINFDSPNFENLLNALAAENFQSIVSLPPNREDEILINKNGSQTLSSVDCTRAWHLSIVGKAFGQ